MSLVRDSFWNIPVLRLILSLVTLHATASCTAHEPGPVDGLEPDPATDTLAVIPQDVSLPVGDSVTFTALDTTSGGTVLSGPIAWSVSGGADASISEDGVFSATAAGEFVVQANRDGHSGRSQVTVLETVSLASIAIKPNVVTLQPGAAFAFSVNGTMSDGSTVPVTGSWAATGGVVTGAGLYTAGATAGHFRVIVTVDGDFVDTASVTIAAGPPTLQSIVLSPGTVSLATGATRQFTAVGRMSDGSTSTVSVNYSATGGTITSGGLYTAGSTPGNFRVIAVRQGDTKADTASVTITGPAPTLTAVVVTPASASLATGATRQFTAVGRLSNGSTTSVLVTWSETGGSISGTGLYTAGSTPGSFRVIAVRQGDTMADTATVTVTASGATLSAVVLTPATVSLAPRAKQQFTAQGKMSDGSSTAVSVTYTATGGTITTTGLYTAGSTAGTFRVIAVQQGGTKADTSAVTVTAGPAPTLSAVEVTPATLSLAAGATQQFAAVGRMSDGSTQAVTVTWSETGGTITTGGLYTAGSTAGTFRVIAVQQGGTKADTSAVTVTAGPAPTLSAVEVTPATLSLAAGATQQFAAVGRLSGGSTQAVTVTWSETGGTITTGGLYTAGSTAGTFRVIAVQQGGTKADTSAVTVTAGAAPTLSAVEVTPATVSLAAGATQQFAAVGRLSGGSTQAVTVTWSETGGTITAAGLYTAGSTAGTFRVIAVQQGGTKADTSAITVTASAAAPVPPVQPAPSGGTPDPALLPGATGQAAVSASAYTALPYYSASGTQLGTNPRNMPVGSYYVDPSTGVKVVRLTSPTAPYAASGTWMSGVDYAEGGLRVGRPSGTSYPIPVVAVGSGGGQGFRLITFDLSNYAVGLRGSLPGGSAEIARAMSYVTPNVMYTIDGGVLRKWNVAGSTPVEIVSAPFPKDLRAHLHGQSTFTWFQGSDDDRWFSMMAGFSGPYLVGFDAQTNTVTEKSVSGIDEPKMDRDGRYVWARGSTPYVWDMQANTLATVSGSQPSYDGHGGVTRGYAFGNPNDGRAGWSINLKSATPSYQYLGAAFNLDNMYLQGGWVDQAAGGTTAQWVALGYQTGGGGEPGPMKYRYGALGLYKLDGSDHRLLANAYNSGNVNGTPDYYANTLWPNLAPDGKFLLFKSNQLVAAGFSSLFAAIVPGR